MLEETLCFLALSSLSWHFQFIHGYYDAAHFVARRSKEHSLWANTALLVYIGHGVGAQGRWMETGETRLPLLCDPIIWLFKQGSSCQAPVNLLILGGGLLILRVTPSFYRTSYRNPNMRYQDHTWATSKNSFKDSLIRQKDKAQAH